jgi:hypothetical protein
MSGAAYESMSLQRRIMRQALPNLCRTFAATMPLSKIFSFLIFMILLALLIIDYW